MRSFGELEKRAHVVAFPYPAQGHINLLMEFAKRLLSHNLSVTFVITEKVRKRMANAQNDSINGVLPNMRIETISDRLTPDFDGKKSSDMENDLLKKVGSVSCEHLIEKLNTQAERVSCIVYDSFLEWVSQIAKKFGIPLAFFWTQSCAVYSIYYHYHKRSGDQDGGLENGINQKAISKFPRLHPLDLPSFIQASNPYPSILKWLLDTFNLISESTWILGNSFSELEVAEIQSMDPLIQIRTVGPLVPSSFLDGNNPKDTDIGTHLWKAKKYVNWLNTKEKESVIYVSFGSFISLSKEQIHEIAFGLKASGHCFLWVIRPSDNNKENITTQDLPEGFLDEIGEKGLVEPWCPQLMVLSHFSIACFMTHCGWNSTLESLVLGVPMIAFPQFSDQPTNAAYVEEHWKVGVRMKKKEDGLVGREEVHRIIKEVMRRGVELRKNSLRWKTLAMRAIKNDGSSHKNIEYFVEDLVNSASPIPSTMT